MKRALPIAAVVLLSIPPAARAEPSAKTASTFYPATVRARAAANAARHPWARARVEQAVAGAKPWAETDDETLWNMIFSPDVWRAMCVNVDRGCPTCGPGLYKGKAPHAFAWTRWVPGRPWKILCPNCNAFFPTNDYAAFYKSGLSPKDGLFHFDQADRKLLFNADHPDPSDPLHLWGVDDGRGWQRLPGGPREKDYFIAHHAGFGLWTQIGAALRSLADAHALTGEPVYAHKCAILLDRLADVFPGYDGATQLVNPQSGGFWDGLIGPNYWDGGMWEQRAIDYDKIVEGIGALPETLAFLRDKGRRFRTPLPKESVEDIRRNIEQRILVETGRHPARIDMNGASTEMARLTVDLVLRGRGALAELVRERLPRIVPPEHLNDDGSGNERSLGYDSGAFKDYCQLIERLAALDPDVARAALDAQPRLRAAFEFWPDVWCVEKFIPNIGDSGSPGFASPIPGSPGAWLALYAITGNPRHAQVAVRAAGGDPAALPRSIHAADPEGLVARAVAANAAAPWHTPGVVKRDYRLGILRAGEGKQAKAVTLFYSPQRGTSSHSHFDAMTLGLFSHGLEMVCEQGYPLFTGGWPARWQWTSHTRSHATVVVDGACQQYSDGGRLLAFAQRDGVRLISAEAPAGPYPSASVYRRTVLLVDVSPERHFVVDVFRVRGGGDHLYTVPVFYGDPTPAGLELAPHADLHDGYVTGVTTAPAKAPWHVDFAVRDSWTGAVAAHLRVHGPASDATVLLGKGETRLGRDKPERLPYLFVRRNGASPLDSAFVAVYEPYADSPFLADRAVTADVAADRVEVRVANAGGGSPFTFAVRDAAPDAVTVAVRLPTGDAFDLGGAQEGR